MTDAKKLNSAPEAPLANEPQLFAPVGAATEPAVGIVSSEPTLLNVSPPAPPAPPLRLRRLASRLLIFFLLGLVTFGLGAAITVALVTGALDSHTAELKAMSKHLKELMHQYTGK